MNSYDWGLWKCSARQLLCTGEGAHGSKNKRTMGARSAGFFFAHAPFQVRAVKTLVGAFFALQPIKDTYARGL